MAEFGKISSVTAKIESGNNAAKTHFKNMKARLAGIRFFQLVIVEEIPQEKLQAPL
ncbi:MAG: hypothetical protein ACOYK9_03625 [Chlamydiia bacterium]